MSRAGFGYGRFGGNSLDLVFGMRRVVYLCKNACELDFLDALKACPFGSLSRPEHILSRPHLLGFTFRLPQPKDAPSYMKESLKKKKRRELGSFCAGHGQTVLLLIMMVGRMFLVTILGQKRKNYQTKGPIYRQSGGLPHHDPKESRSIGIHPFSSRSFQPHSDLKIL